MLYLTIRAGRTAATAEPVLATSDVELIGLVGREIARKLGADHVPAQVLRLARRVAGPDASVTGAPLARGDSAQRAGSSARPPLTAGTLSGRFGTPPRRRICAREGCGKAFRPPKRRRGSEKVYCSRRCCRLASRMRCGRHRSDGLAPVAAAREAQRRKRLIAVAPADLERVT